MEHQTILITWSGPVSYETLLDTEGGGLYILSGTLKGKQKDEVQYIGITERDFGKRLNDPGHKINLIRRNMRIWLGKVICPAEASRTILERAETMLVYVNYPPLNIRKKINPPKPTTLISHWYKDNGDARYNKQGLLKDFSDVVSWDGQYWREGDLAVFDD